MLLLIGILHAETSDKFKINLGAMYINNYNTEAKYTTDTAKDRSLIDFNNDLALDYDSSLFRLDGYYRFNDRHRINYAYYAARSSGSKTIDEEFEWEGNDIGISANIQTHFNMDIYKLSYAYSFYHEKDLELALSAGFHITSVDLGLSASGEINDIPGDTYKTTEEVLLPLPVFGLQGEYAINDYIYATLKAEYFFLEYENYSGSILASTLGLEYRYSDNFGVGIGYNADIITFEDDSDNKEFKMKNRLDGAILYLSYTY